MFEPTDMALGVNGKGQIHLQIALRLVKQIPFSFLREGVNIWYNECILYVDSNKCLEILT